MINTFTIKVKVYRNGQQKISELEQLQAALGSELIPVVLDDNNKTLSVDSIIELVHGRY